MNDILDIEIILKKQKYHMIYNFGWILLIVLFVFIYVSCIYSYKKYYVINGVMENGFMKLFVELDDIKYITNNDILKTNSVAYKYHIKEIGEDLYVDNSFINYKYIYLKVDNLYNIDNYVYEIKLLKEEKKIIEYLKEYI